MKDHEDVEAEDAGDGDATPSASDVRVKKETEIAHKDERGAEEQGEVAEARDGKEDGESSNDGDVDECFCQSGVRLPFDYRCRSAKCQLDALETHRFERRSLR